MRKLKEKLKLRDERTSSLRCEQVWTSQNRCEVLLAFFATSLHGLPPNFTHALKICLGRFLSTFRSARLIGSGGNSPSSRFIWRKVWTGVKCHFSTAHHHNQYVVGKLSISRVPMWMFTWIWRKTKKVTAIDNSSMKAVAWNHPQKVLTTTFLRRNSTSGRSLESSRSRKLKYAVSAGLAKR